MSQLGTNIRKIREFRDFTIQNMADALEISPTTYSKIENGEKDPKQGELEKIANVLGATVPELHTFHNRKIINHFAPEFDQQAVYKEADDRYVAALRAENTQLKLEIVALREERLQLNQLLTTRSR